MPEDLLDTAAPTPTAMRAEWWPVFVRLPGGGPVLMNAKVYAADTGLYVYTNRDRGDGKPTLEWYSPIDYDKTPRPSGRYGAGKAGYRILTEAGEVIVQEAGNCGCGAKRVKHYRPEWATRVQTWEG
jgi:hypothetical protein